MGIDNVANFLSSSGVNKSPQTGSNAQRELPTFADTIMYVPLGKYYSEIDGSVFEVVSDEYSRSNPIVLKYTEPLTLKCHARIIDASVNIFKKMYRKFRKDYLARNFGAMLLIRRQTVKALERARERIRIRKATLIQSVFRMSPVYNDYKIMRRGFLTLQILFKSKKMKRMSKTLILNKRVSSFQALLRGRKSRLQIKNIRKKGNVVAKTTSKIVNIIKQRRIQMATKIQCAYRVFCALKVYSKLLREQKAKQNLKPLSQMMAAKAMQRKLLATSRKNEGEESIAMAKEELLMRKFLRLEALRVKQQQEDERRRVDERLRQAHIKKLAGDSLRKRAIVLVQRQLRMFTALSKYHKMRSGFLILQAVARLRARRIARKRREARLRREADEADGKKNQKSKSASTQIAGYGRFVPGVVRNLFFRTKASSVEESSTTNILAGVLNRRAVKIQAVYRMHKTRRVYIAKRLALGMGPPGQAKRPRQATDSAPRK